jgi:hypothetical protein
VLRGRRATDAVICLDVWVVDYCRLVGTRKPNAYVCDKAIREEWMTVRTKQMEERRLRMRNGYGCSGGAHRTMVQWGRQAQNACLFAVESMLLTAPMPRARSSLPNGSSQLTIDNVSET